MSVSAHSESNKKYVIFSVYQGCRLDVTNHACILDVLDNMGINYKELLGQYKGDKEQSVLIAMDDYPALRKILRDTFNQECTLLLENYKHGLYKATFDYLQRPPESAHQEFAGYLRSVPEHIAMLHESWTYDEKQKTYFIVTPEDETRMDKLKELKYA